MKHIILSVGKLASCNAYVLKIIALLCMTIDHIAMYNSDFPLVGKFMNEMRLIGRIAAPLFMFLFVYSVRYTHNRKLFLSRLYLAALVIKLSECIVNLCVGDILGYPMFHNIIFTFFYTASYIYLLEVMISSGTKAIYQRLLAMFGIVLITYLPDKLWHLFDHSGLLHSFEGKWYSISRSILDGILANPIHTEYGFMLILLGILMYFARSKKWQVIIFTLFCLFWPMLDIIISNSSVAQEFAKLLFALPWADLYMDGTQWFGMLLALPFMLLYNGKSPNKNKWFFYGYYALHRYILVILRVLC